MQVKTCLFSVSTHDYTDEGKVILTGVTLPLPQTSTAGLNSYQQTKMSQENEKWTEPYKRGYSAGYAAGLRLHQKSTTPSKQPVQSPPPIRDPNQELMELRYMVGRGWLWSALVPYRWKTDTGLVAWVKRGWVTVSLEKGFKITEKGEAFCDNYFKPTVPA